MAHEANRVDDGFWTIIQDVNTNRITLLRCGEQVKLIQPGRVLSFDELHTMLIRERADINSLEVEEDGMV